MSVPAGRRPVDVAPAPDGSPRLFVVNRRSDSITVVDVEVGEAVRTIEAPGVLGVTSWLQD